MPTYLEQVKASCEQMNAQREERKRSVDASRAKEWRDQMRPLNNRLADLLATIPDEIKRNGLSLSDLQVQLRGRKASKAHCGEVATALRQLGYRRVRVWKQSDDAGFPATWVKP
jgi:hypothetical protein